MKQILNTAIKTALLALCVANAGWAQTTIRINEVYTRGTSGNRDWVEIYNSASTSIDVSGFKIYDNGGRTGTKPKKVLPSGTTVAANGFIVIVTDTASFTGDLSDFGLSNNGDSVWVENTTGLVIDSVFIPALGVDTSYARKPDGTGTFVKSTPPTKGKTNTPAASAVVQQLSTVPGTYRLEQNFPNPFNPSTTIRFVIPSAGHVRLEVFDLLGQHVTDLVDQVLAAGTHSVRFEAGSMIPAGMYLYRLHSGGATIIKRMTLVK